MLQDLVLLGREAIRELSGWGEMMADPAVTLCDPNILLQLVTDGIYVVQTNSNA